MGDWYLLKNERQLNLGSTKKMHVGPFSDYRLVSKKLRNVEAETEQGVPPYQITRLRFHQIPHVRAFYHRKVLYASRNKQKELFYFRYTSPTH